MYSFCFICFFYTKNIVKKITLYFRNNFNMLILCLGKNVSMLKTVALLYSFIFLWKLIILFQDYLISRKFKRTAFIQNRFFRFFFGQCKYLNCHF